uniref:ASST-domain-containing protein n=1 Tax=Moniliophthora roreri TaxID=221103 RepID=A0A0W0F7T0_MONRR
MLLRSWKRSLALSLLFNSFVNADSVLFESNEYLSGTLGAAPFQSYFSSDYTPPAWNIVVPRNRTRRVTPGYLFVAPRGTAIAQFGAVIYADDGTMIWNGNEYGEAMAFQVVTYMGQPHISLWQGNWTGEGIGSGFHILLNQHYEVVANYTTDLEGELGHTYADFHETGITTNNTGLLAAYETKSRDLSPYNGPSSGWIRNSVIQELNITSGKALFTWSFLDHVDPGDCYFPVASYGTETSNAWDYFHVNSIEKDDFGNYLISSRHCSTLYYLDGTNGNIIWRLGGHDSSFTMGTGTEFSFQHDARWISLNDTAGRLSLFDNAGMYGVYNEESARGLVIDLDFSAMAANLVQDYIPYIHVVSESQGSVQLQPNGDVLIGWGSMPWLAEYSSTGDLVWCTQFGATTDVSGYRTLRYNWTGYPTTTPSIQLVGGGASALLSIHASWNGATEINKWELLGASDESGSGAMSLYNRTRTGYETTITVSTKNNAYSHFAMRAIDRNNQPLGRSNFVSGAATYSLRASVSGLAVLLVMVLQWEAR